MRWCGHERSCTLQERLESEDIQRLTCLPPLQVLPSSADARVPQSQQCRATIHPQMPWQGRATFMQQLLNLVSLQEPHPTSTCRYCFVSLYRQCRATNGRQKPARGRGPFTQQYLMRSLLEMPSQAAPTGFAVRQTRNLHCATGCCLNAHPAQGAWILFALPDR